MTTTDESRISVVVPLYNVADYIGPCIASLQAQTMPDFDVVIVDDGSTDASAEIARDRTSQDPRFTVVTQGNRGPGPGGGRNGGLASTRSDRLLFIDSDDALTPNALHAMVAAFETAPEIDLVSTSAARLCGVALFPSHLHDMSHPFAETQTTAAQSPWLMFDSTPWNKAFRRDFFDRVVGRWPERQLYEDIVPMTKALLNAERVAVLDEQHYLWRVRGEGSITHHRTGLEGDIAQLEQLGAAREHVLSAASPELLRWFDWKTLTQDLLWMTQKLIVVAGPDRHRLRAAVAETLGKVDPTLIEATQPALRRCFHAILAGDSSTVALRVAANRHALLQDRRHPDAALRAPTGAVTLRGCRSGESGVTIDVTSQAFDLRGSTLSLTRQPPWDATERPAVLRVPATRSLRSAARFRIEADRIPPSTTAEPAQWFVEIASRTGQRSEITRSLVTAVQKRLGDPVVAPGPIRPYIDDGRLRLATGAPVPRIVDVATSAGMLVLTGCGAEPARDLGGLRGWLTRPGTNESFELEWSHVGADRFELLVPASRLAQLGLQPHAISVSSNANPAVPAVVAITSAVPFRIGELAGWVSPGQYDIAQLRVHSGPAQRLQSFSSELASRLPRRPLARPA